MTKELEKIVHTMRQVIQTMEDVVIDEKMNQDQKFTNLAMGMDALGKMSIGLIDLVNPIQAANMVRLIRAHSGQIQEIDQQNGNIGNFQARSESDFHKSILANWRPKPGEWEN